MEIKQIIRTPDVEEYLNRLVGLLNLVFGAEKFNKTYLRKLYFDNPAGDVFGFDAWEDDQIVGHYALIPVPYVIDGVKKNAMLSLNTAIHPDYRKHGLFLKLFNQTEAELQGKDVDLLIGVANQNSTHGFIKKLGWSLLGELNVRLTIWGTQRNPSAGRRISSHKSDEWLNWRIGLRKPYFTKDKKWYSRSAFPGVQVEMTSIERRWENMPSQWFAGFVFTVGFNNAAVLSIPLPRFLRPSPLNLIYKAVNGASIQFKKEDILFEPLDFDAF